MKVALQVHTADAVGKRTALVVVDDAVVAYYLAPLPEPRRPQLHFLTGHGNAIEADLGALAVDDDNWCWAVRFRNREDLERLRARLVERRLPALFEMLAQPLERPRAGSRGL